MVKNKLISRSSYLFTLLILSHNVFAAPANDNLANAINITTLPFSDTVSKADADSGTFETSEVACSGGGTKSWWYSYTPVGNMSIQITSGHSDNSLPTGCDIRLGVYTGTAFPLTEVSCTDDDGFNGNGEDETIALTGGVTYYIGAKTDSDVIETTAVCKTDVVLVGSPPPPPPPTPTSASVNLLDFSGKSPLTFSRKIVE